MKLLKLGSSLLGLFLMVVLVIEVHYAPPSSPGGAPSSPMQSIMSMTTAEGGSAFHLESSRTTESTSDSHFVQTRVEDVVISRRLGHQIMDKSAALAHQTTPGRNSTKTSATSSRTSPPSRHHNGKPKSHDERENLYWNLTCPLEMSIFSGSHMGGEFLRRAEEARQLVMDHHVVSQIQSHLASWSSRRIVFVGDSLLRQVFISLTCLLLSSSDRNRTIQGYAVPWFETGHSRAPHPHTVQRGRHSKFQEARVLLQNEAELIYHHGIGKLLELGQDYTSHETNDWLDACSNNEPLSTNVMEIPRSHRGEYETNDESAKRERIHLNRNDVVILNGSVHGKRDSNIANIAALLDCIKFVKGPRDGWPTFAYLVTGTEHFPTPDGKFDEQLLATNATYQCRPDAPRHELQDQDAAEFRSRTTLLGQDVVEHVSRNNAGNLHVGGKDCLHWMQPGIPDLLAANVSAFVASLSSSLDQRLAMARSLF